MVQQLGPLGEGRPGDLSACVMCGGVSRGGGGVVHSNGPNPPRRHWQHQEGTPVLVSSETSGWSQQRDDAAGGEGIVCPIVAAPMASPTPVAIGGRCPSPPVARDYRTDQ